MNPYGVLILILSFSTVHCGMDKCGFDWLQTEPSSGKKWKDLSSDMKEEVLALHHCEDLCLRKKGCGGYTFYKYSTKTMNVCRMHRQISNIESCECNSKQCCYAGFRPQLNQKNILDTKCNRPSLSMQQSSDPKSHGEIRG